MFNNLEPNGILTVETRDLMRKERCGNPDVGCGKSIVCYFFTLMADQEVNDSHMCTHQ